MNKYKDKLPKIESKIELSLSDMSNIDITQLTDEQLKDFILKTWIHAPGNFKFEAMASLLTAEANRRVLVKAQEEGKKSNAFALGISVLALLISLVSVVITSLDFQSGNEWQEKQISLLERQLEIQNRLSSNLFYMSQPKPINSNHKVEIKIAQ